MASKIVIGSLVILVLASLGTVGMMYVNNEIGVPTWDGTPTATPEDACKPSSQDDVAVPCCRQPVLQPTYAPGGCPMQQHAATEIRGQQSSQE